MTIIYCDDNHYNITITLLKPLWFAWRALGSTDSERPSTILAVPIHHDIPAAKPIANSDDHNTHVTFLPCEKAQNILLINIPFIADINGLHAFRYESWLYFSKLYP